MPSSNGGMQAAWISVGVCIDILFIADTSDKDTPISAKVRGRRGEACDETVFFFVVVSWRNLNENREGTASPSSLGMEISDVES